MGCVSFFEKLNEGKKFHFVNGKFYCKMEHFRKMRSFKMEHFKKSK